MKTKNNIVIIGGGLIGLSVARALMISGYRNIFVIQQKNAQSGKENRPPGGIIRQYHTSTLFRGRLKTGANLLRSYQLKSTRSLFAFGSSIHLGTDQDHQELTSTKPDPLDWDTIDPTDLPDALLPYPRDHSFWMSYEGGGIGDVGSFKTTILDELKKSDRVTLRPTSEVRDGHRENDEWVLYLSDSERLKASVIVNTSGVYANELGERLGLKQQKYAILNKTCYYCEQSMVPNQHNVYLDRPHGNTFRSVNGGTLISSSDERPQDVNNLSEKDQEIPSFQNSTGQTYPDLPPINVEQSWLSTFSRTKDHTPIIRRDPAEGSVIWATGMNDYRLPLSLWVGDHVHEILKSMPDQ